MKLFETLLFGAVLLLISPYLLKVLTARKQGKALTIIILLIQNNSELIEEIGEIQTTGVNAYTIDLNIGKAELQMDLTGTKASKSIHVLAHKDNNNEWHIDID